MLQRNISGSTLTVMTDPPCEIAPGGLLEHDSLLAGFEAVDAQPATAVPVSHEAPDPSAGELPAAPVVVVPDEPEPAVAAPVVAVPAPEVPAPAPVVIPQPVVAPAVVPVVAQPAAPAWPATPGGTVTAV